MWNIRNSKIAIRRYLFPQFKVEIDGIGPILHEDEWDKWWIFGSLRMECCRRNTSVLVERRLRIRTDVVSYWVCRQIVQSYISRTLVPIHFWVEIGNPSGSVSSGWNQWTRRASRSSFFPSYWAFFFALLAFKALLFRRQISRCFSSLTVSSGIASNVALSRRLLSTRADAWKTSGWRWSSPFGFLKQFNHPEIVGNRSVKHRDDSSN